MADSHRFENEKSPFNFLNFLRT